MSAPAMAALPPAVEPPPVPVAQPLDVNGAPVAADAAPPPPPLGAIGDGAIAPVQTAVGKVQAMAPPAPPGNAPVSAALPQGVAPAAPPPVPPILVPSNAAGTVVPEGPPPIPPGALRNNG
jgi:hypothetical protein